MNDVRYYEVKAEEAGQRLDNYLIRLLKGVPKSHIYRIIRSGEVRINKKRAEASSRISVHDSIRVPPIRLAEEKSIYVGKQLEVSLENAVLYEDDNLLILNKPAGIAVHGGSGLSLGVIEAFRKIRPDDHYLELVHRLDKETSGCLILAKKRSVLRAIQSLLEQRKIKKVYWALWHGAWVGAKKIILDQPLLKNTLQSGERVVRVDPTGKKSETEFRLLENYTHACLIEALPKTGRTHQIRVHSAYLQHPILGDEKYSHDYKKKLTDDFENRLYLHARAIQFNLNGKEYYYEAQLDGKFTETLNRLRAEEV